ncbi:hypothetical protein ADM96_19590 [Burkholderia sp. ST111]|nr:hypothetical protein ADM96_19590 [Burkholderia sp. ST111]
MIALLPQGRRSGRCLPLVSRRERDPDYRVGVDADYFASDKGQILRVKPSAKARALTMSRQFNDGGGRTFINTAVQ